MTVKPYPASDSNPMLSLPFTLTTLSAVRHALTAAATTAGLRGDALEDFVFAVNELVINAIQHAGGHGHLTLEFLDRQLRCRVTDHGGPGPPPVITTPDARVAGGRGIWTADNLVDLDLRQDACGRIATITTSLPLS